MKTGSNLSKDFHNIAKYADTFVDVCVCLQHSRVMLSLTITYTQTHTVENRSQVKFRQRESPKEKTVGYNSE